MRFTRLMLLLLGVYFVFIGGGAYYSLFLPVRAFHHVFVTLLLTVWLFNRLKSGQGLPATPLNKAIYAMVVIWILSALASIDPRMAFEHLWFLLIHVLMFMGLSDLIRRGRQRLLMDVQFVIAALIVFVTGLELASWYFGLGIIPGTSVGWADVRGPGTWLPLVLPRVELALNVSTLLAGFVAPLIVMAVVWAITADRRYRKPLYTLALFLSLILFLTLARGGFLSIAAAFSVFIVFQALQSRRLTRFANWPVFIGGAAIIGVVLILLIPRITSISSRVAGDEGRRDLWAGAIAIASDYPLLGVGPGMFGRAFRTYRHADIVQDKLASAHNLYLNTLAETGLIGLAGASLIVIFFVHASWNNWQQSNRAKQMRIEGAIAALIGLGVHSLVDMFSITPIVLLGLLLVAYCVTRPREGFEIPPAAPRYTAVAAILMLIGYGLWLMTIDFAQWSYQKSLIVDAAAFNSLSVAENVDPSLHLYALQRANLSGILFPDDAETIASYERALDLEPSWDMGWINLAAIVLTRNETNRALDALDRARKINAQNTASLHWARIAEEYTLANPQAIIDSYVTYLRFHPLTARSSFWQASDLRHQAVIQHIETLPIDQQYRVLLVQSPEQAEQLIPADPSSGGEWWVQGQVALEQGDAQEALTHFNRAIEMEPINGDYYVSRAQAEVSSDAQAAMRDLDLAVLVTTAYSSPNAIRAELAATQDEKNDWLAQAVPSRFTPQEFAAVMYDRPASFEVLPAMADLGPGRAFMQPWYDLAAYSLSEEQPQEAANIYRAILQYAPDEQDAAEALDQLVEAP